MRGPEMDISVKQLDNRNVIAIVWVGLLVSVLGTVSGCDRSENNEQVLRTREGGIIVSTELSGGVVRAQIENRSGHVVLLARQSAVGYGPNRPRLALRIHDRNNQSIEPCAHLDPVMGSDEPLVLDYGGMHHENVRISLIKRIYCLSPGRYRVSAMYENIGEPAVFGNSVNIVVH